MTSTPEEVALAGGRANVGRVVRVGDEVARPRYPQTASVDVFLTFLIDQGLSFVPTPKGTDDQGRQRLSWLPGDVAISPYPSWAFGEELLVEVASAQRQLHRVAEAFVPAPDAVWAVSAGDYFPERAEGTLMCHNDLCMSNIVVDPTTHRSVTGIIDFDYVRPVDRLFDIAVALRHWVPYGAITSEQLPDLDRIRRFGLFCDVHELTGQQRSRIVDLSIDFLVKARDNVKRLAEAGQVGFQQILADGYEANNVSTVAWLRDSARLLTGGE